MGGWCQKGKEGKKKARKARRRQGMCVYMREFVSEFMACRHCAALLHPKCVPLELFALAEHDL